VEVYKEGGIMNRLSYNWKISPIIGIGAWVDVYEKEVHGLDGWAYNIILPLVRVQIWKIYFDNT
jgi:hypothetical protein